jgi:hypothetical protein
MLSHVLSENRLSDFSETCPKKKEPHERAACQAIDQKLTVKRKPADGWCAAPSRWRDSAFSHGSST